MLKGFQSSKTIFSIIAESLSGGEWKIIQLETCLDGFYLSFNESNSSPNFRVII